MPLANMKDLLVAARAGGYAVGAFEFWSYDSAQAVVEAACEAGAPVILQAGKLENDYAGGPDILAEIARRTAKMANVPVALHLDHATELDSIGNAIEAGFTSVMIDASHLPFDENAAITLKVVEMARPRGVAVEAEIGLVGGTEGMADASLAEAYQTDPFEAARFIAATGIDALAVAIGTAHGAYRFPPHLNVGRLAEIAERVSIPLVLHGGSGVPDESVLESIKYGIAKVNICTEFITAYGEKGRRLAETQGFAYSVKSYFAETKAAGKRLAFEKIKLFSRS